MVGGLDEVAERLAAMPLMLRHLDNPLTAYADEREGVVATVVGVAGAMVSAVTMLRNHRLAPDERETRRLYQAATGADRDQAKADLAFVSDRLSGLVHAPDGPEGDALVRAAARRLVAWVAGGRGPDDQMAGVEAAFDRWVEVAEDDRPDPRVLMERSQAYVAAWEEG